MGRSEKGELFNTYRTGKPVPMSRSTAKEVAAGCSSYTAEAHADPSHARGRTKKPRRRHHDANRALRCQIVKTLRALPPAVAWEYVESLAIQRAQIGLTRTLDVGQYAGTLLVQGFPRDRLESILEDVRGMALSNGQPSDAQRVRVEGIWSRLTSWLLR
jgi:hypothetical protein